MIKAMVFKAVIESNLLTNGSALLPIDGVTLHADQTDGNILSDDQLPRSLHNTSVIAQEF